MNHFLMEIQRIIKMVTLSQKKNNLLSQEAYFKQLPSTNGWDSVLCARKENIPFRSESLFIVFTPQHYFGSKFLCPLEIYLWIFWEGFGRKRKSDILSSKSDVLYPLTWCDSMLRSPSTSAGDTFFLCNSSGFKKKNNWIFSRSPRSSGLFMCKTSFPLKKTMFAVFFSSRFFFSACLWNEIGVNGPWDPKQKIKFAHAHTRKNNRLMCFNGTLIKLAFAWRSLSRPHAKTIT